jgi:hypothetical protein
MNYLHVIFLHPAKKPITGQSIILYQFIKNKKMNLENYEQEIISRGDGLEFKTDLSFSINEANRIGVFIFIISIILFSPPYIFIWGFNEFYEGLKNFLFNIKITIPVIIAGIFIHEFIHGIFIVVVGKQSFKQVRFGFNPDYYAPYAHSKTPLKAIIYKISTLAPLVILGFIPVLTAYFIKSPFLLFFGIVFIFAASGDILIYWKIRKVPKNHLVADHPERAGCYVYENPF